MPVWRRNAPNQMLGLLVCAVPRSDRSGDYRDAVSRSNMRLQSRLVPNEINISVAGRTVTYPVGVGPG
jgi:hypothetical protein